MNSENINRDNIRIIKIGDEKYKIVIFQNDVPEIIFEMSLQPTGSDEELPQYQLSDKSQVVPKWLNNKLQIISDLIKSEFS